MARIRSKATGDCYRAAAELVIRRPDLNLTLVHATCTGHGVIAGVNFGHAFAEAGDVVFDFSQGREAVVRKEIYYKAGTVRDTQTYTRAEACQMMLATGNYGPWRDGAKKVAHLENKQLTRSKGVGKVLVGK